VNNNNQHVGVIAMFKRKVLASAISFAYLSLAIAPVYASDTEIYVKTDDTAPISPTVMMMFDTSGSMDYCVDNAANTSCADTTKKRINVLKKAMQQILRGDATVSPAVSAAPGYIKMGLSRYHATSSKGGYVLYPARPLDALVQLNPNGYINAVGATGNADGIQGVSQVLTGNELVIGSNGSVTNAAGFQFDRVVVPKGAVVSRAYIEVTASQTQSGPAQWHVEAEDSDSAAEYSAGSAINARTYTTAAADEDQLPDAWTAGTRYRISVTDAMNRVVNRAGWCGDNDVAFRVSNVNVAGVTPTQRTAYSYDGAPTAEDRPKLVVEYLVNTESTTSCAMVPRTTVISLSNNEDDVTWGSTNTTTKSLQSENNLTFNKVTSGVKRIVGLRYRSVPIPASASIQSAYLKIKAQVTNTNVQSTSVTAFNSSSLAAFCTSTSATSCSTDSTLNGLPVHAVTASEATWRPDSNTITLDQVYAIPVTDAVKKVITTAGWASGNHMGFKLSNAGGTTNDTAAFYSRNAGSTKAAQLEINWRERVTDLRSVLTVRDELETAVNALGIPSSTPLGAAYAEAARYLYGMTPKNTGGAPLDYDARVVTSPVAAAAGLEYISPIPDEDKCSANYIFLLTDGEPTEDGAVKENVTEITGASCTTSTNVGTKNWQCMTKLAQYNNTATNRLTKPIRTNTVILGPLDSARTNMMAVAAAGGGTFYEAQNTAALVNAISNTLSDAANRSGSLAAPGVAVNQINRLNHLNQLYYAVFEPNVTYRWDGNLKRYRLSDSGNAIMDNTSPNPLNAIDPTTGLFKEGTQSFWSATADGAQATAGGAASMLPEPDARKMYTFLGSLSTTNTPLTPITFGEPFNTNAKTKMGLSTSASDDIIFKNLINWYKGYAIASLSPTLVDVTSPSVGRNQQLGAALHSQPILINYGYTGPLSTANDVNNQLNYVFFSTLGGTLHAVNANTGAEAFSFIPGEKLNTLRPQFENTLQIVPEFGMDLTWTYYRKDADSNSQIGTGDKVYLYGGMRMGGSNYYALDVTKINAPALLFAIQGGTGKYLSMGQTWSQPVTASVKISGINRPVIIFGGGYDPRHEVAGQFFTGNDLGNQLYIVDALTGEYLWSASGNSGDGAAVVVPSMQFSVPSQPKVIDLDGDGAADHIYFGDLGGQVFRVDFSKTATSTANIVKRVKLFAKLGQTAISSLLEQHRFYEQPEVAVFKDTNGKFFTTVAMGSGYRSHPLNLQTDDNFFVLFDYDVARTNLLTMTPAQEAAVETADGVGGLQAVITKTNLASLNLNSSADAVTTGKKGWYIDLPEAGEKSLASGMIFQKRLTFSTYVPSTGTNNCQPVVGKSKLYAMCMPYGGTCGATSSVTDRVINPNVMSGISGESQVIIVESCPPGSPACTYEQRLLTGTNVSPPPGGSVSQVPVLTPSQRWREKTRNPAN